MIMTPRCMYFWWLLTIGATACGSVSDEGLQDDSAAQSVRQRNELQPADDAAVDHEAGPAIEGGADSSDSSALSVDQCAAQGGSAIGIAGAPHAFETPDSDLTKDDLCPGGRLLIGMIESSDDPNGGLCCRLPPKVEYAECAAMGGTILLDPGSGSSYVQGCGKGKELLGWLSDRSCGMLCGEGGLCCRQTGQ
jgi:hypothetical protein